MNYIFILLILVAAGGVVFALARGLHAFVNMRPGDTDENEIPKSLGRQNQMMFARVKWQALAVTLIILLGILSQAN